MIHDIVERQQENRRTFNLSFILNVIEADDKLTDLTTWVVYYVPIHWNMKHIIANASFQHYILGNKSMSNYNSKQVVCLNTGGQQVIYLFLLHYMVFIISA